MGKIILASYISHGAPTSLVEKTNIHKIYENLGVALKKYGVDTVVISSPHYLSRKGFEVEARGNIPCIQDYYGFPDQLYKFSYEAKNNLDLVSEIVKAADGNDVQVTGSSSWGLDHGAWLPLYFMFPEHDVKVVPVSITTGSPKDHFKFGSVIKSAVDNIDGTVAVIGTGSPVHRLDLIRYGYYGKDRFEPGERFDKALIELVSSGDFNKVINIQKENPSLFQVAAPEGNLNPLYVALGASDRGHFVGETILHEFMYYGVSLVAMVLSAHGELLETLKKFDFHKIAF